MKKVSCQFYALLVHIEFEAKFCPLRGIIKKYLYFRDLISFKAQINSGDAHTKLSDKETRFRSLVMQATGAPTDRTKQVTPYKTKACYFWNLEQCTNYRNKLILDIFLVQ
jgi:hypothetical protein